MPEIHQSLKVEAIVTMFYRAIAALHLMSSGKHQKVVMRNIVHRAIQVMEEAAHKCNFTFQNKVYLLEAELAAQQSKHKRARVAYNDAISTARSSGFIHEQGLACEMAGLHYKRIGDLKRSMTFLCQAQECYFRWGSKLKTHAVAVELERVVAMQTKKFLLDSVR